MYVDQRARAPPTAPRRRPIKDYAATKVERLSRAIAVSIGAPGPTLKRPRSAGRLRPRAGWSRPPSARTPDGPTPARSGASTSGSTAANLDDVALAAYLAELHDAGRASSSASMAVAAACFRAKLAGQPTPAGERTARVLAGYRRTAGDRGRGQARPFGVSDLAAVLATCHRPRRRGRGISSPDVVDTTDGDGVLVTRPPQQDEPGGRDERCAVR